MQHPGTWLRSHLTGDYGLSVSKAAELLGVDRAGFTQTLQGKYAVTPDLALKVEALTGFDPKLLMEMQRLYELDRLKGKREEYARTIQRLEPVAA